MATANITKVWLDPSGSMAFIAAAVNESPGQDVEYIASVPNDAEFQALTNTQKKAKLIQAVKAMRDRQVSPSAAIAGITGTGTV